MVDVWKAFIKHNKSKQQQVRYCALERCMITFLYATLIYIFHRSGAMRISIYKFISLFFISFGRIAHSFGYVRRKLSVRN